MTEVETEFFNIVDAFVRSQLKCFLAEFTPQRGANKYTLCFRPVASPKGSESRYACCHMEVTAEAVIATADAHDADAQEQLLSAVQTRVKSSPIFQ